MTCKRRDDQGYTLVELLVVGVILAILISIALLSYYSSTARARTITCQHNQRLFNEAVYIYEAEHGTPPAIVDDLEDYVEHFDGAVTCPNADGTQLEYDAASGRVTCPNH